MSAPEGRLPEGNMLPWRVGAWEVWDEPYVSLGSATVTRVDTSRRDDPEFTDPRPVGFTADLEPDDAAPVAMPQLWEGED